MGYHMTHRIASKEVLTREGKGEVDLGVSRISMMGINADAAADVGKRIFVLPRLALCKCRRDR